MADSEFKPTPQTAVDLERALMELKTKKGGIIFKKVKIQDELAALKRERKQLNPASDKAQEITRQRAKMKTEAQGYELEILEINNEMKNKRMLLIEVENYLRVNDTKLDDKVAASLTRLKDKYSRFAADHTRISSMKTMAAEFVQELEAIINMRK